MATAQTELAVYCLVQIAVTCSEFSSTLSKSTPISSTSTPSFRIAFVSSCSGDWGGSEELWAGTALFLTQAGHTVQAFKTTVDDQHRRVVALRQAGCPVTDLDPDVTLSRRLVNRLLPYRKQYTRHKISQRILERGLRALQPHLTVISQGSNYDGCILAEVCHRLGLAYVLLAQKAVDFFLPPYLEREQVQDIYQTARRCFFVSRHNLELTQLQLGMSLPQAEVVWNPYNVPFQGELPWPAAAADGVLHLACVARLHVPDKGQDLLLQVLAQPKWRMRPLHITFYGTGPDEAALRGMVDFLGVEAQVSFAGYVADVANIWQRHHALILPSRHEGLPLALVEAMLSGRPAIAADAGGMAELLVDNETGYLAAAATTQAMDEALERAWANRNGWPQLGAEAARQARAVVPKDAAAVFGGHVLALAREARA
ncbi:glycosyltransferase family 4 protein [Hymenobacter metallicola]|uniref:Glycosyltransferase n=1 Tax=Hymenobacter metallicola TaxID=2563114 RepID=A0A4Z0QHQ1_9BACT|nr:glycosyltransferase family 4 protein [Hymenobacter metallicola]TGE29540.1 glycosyltransferase [Hymenobacter metallicola]